MQQQQTQDELDEPEPLDPIQIDNMLQKTSDAAKYYRSARPPPPVPSFRPPFDNGLTPLPMLQSSQALANVHHFVHGLLDRPSPYDFDREAAALDPSVIVETITFDNDEDPALFTDSTLRSEAAIHNNNNNQPSQRRVEQRMHTRGSQQQQMSLNTPLLPSNLHDPNYAEISGQGQQQQNSIPFFPADDPSSLISNPSSFDDLGLTTINSPETAKTKALRYWRRINSHEIALVAQYVMKQGGPGRAIEIIRSEITIHGLSVLLDGIPVKPEILSAFTSSFIKFIEDAIYSMMCVGYVLYRLVPSQSSPGIRDPIVQDFQRYNVAFYIDDTGITHYSVFDQNNARQDDIIIYEWIPPDPNGSLNSPMSKLFPKSHALKFGELRTLECANNTSMTPLIFRPESRHDSSPEANRKALALFFKHFGKNLDQGTVYDSGSFSQSITGPGGGGGGGMPVVNRLLSSTVRDFRQNNSGPELFTSSLDDPLSGVARAAGLGRSINSVVNSSRDQQMPLSAGSSLSQSNGNTQQMISATPFGVRLDPTLDRQVVVVGPGWECDVPAPPPPFPLQLEEMRRDLNQEVAMVTGVPAVLIRGGASASYNPQHQDHGTMSPATFSILHVTVSKFAKTMQGLVDSITNASYSRAPFEILAQPSAREKVHGVRVARSHKDGANARTSDHARLSAWLDALRRANVTANHRKLDMFVNEQEEMARAMESWVNVEDVANAFEAIENEQEEKLAATRKRKRTPQAQRSRASLTEAKDEQALAMERRMSRTAELRSRIIEASGLNTFSQVQVDIRYMSVIYPELMRTGMISNPFAAGKNNDSGGGAGKAPALVDTSLSYLEARQKNPLKGELATEPNRTRIQSMMEREDQLLRQSEMTAAGRSVGTDSIYKNMDPYGTARPSKAPPPDPLDPIPDPVDLISDQLDTADTVTRDPVSLGGGARDYEPGEDDHELGDEPGSSSSKGKPTEAKTRQQLGALIMEHEGRRDHFGKQLQYHEGAKLHGEMQLENLVYKLKMQKRAVEKETNLRKQADLQNEQLKTEVMLKRHREYLNDVSKRTKTLSRAEATAAVIAEGFRKKLDALNAVEKDTSDEKVRKRTAEEDEIQDTLFRPGASADDLRRYIGGGRGGGSDRPDLEHEEEGEDSTEEGEAKEPEKEEGTWGIEEEEESGKASSGSSRKRKRTSNPELDLPMPLRATDAAKMGTEALKTILKGIQDEMKRLETTIRDSTGDSRNASRQSNKRSAVATESSNVAEQITEDLEQGDGYFKVHAGAGSTKRKSVSRLKALRKNATAVKRALAERG